MAVQLQRENCNLGSEIMPTAHLRTLLDPSVSSFECVAALEAFDIVTPASVLMRCQTSRKLADHSLQDIPSSIRLDFLTDFILRLRYTPDDTIQERASPMIAGQFDAPPAIQVDERHTSLLAQAGNLRVEVARRPFAMRIYDPHERVVWRTRDLVPDASHLQQAQSDARSIGSISGDNESAFISLDLRHDEHIFGFGESAGRVDKRETFHLLWNDPAVAASLKRIPFYMSTRGYGMFVHTANAVRCHVGDLEPTALSILVDDTCALDLFIIYGPDLKDILPRYTALTGTPTMPPKWTFGLWLLPDEQSSAVDVEASATDLRERTIPGDAICWPSKLRITNDQRATIKRLRALGFRVSTRYRLSAVERTQTAVSELLGQGAAAIEVDLDHNAPEDVSARHQFFLEYGNALSAFVGAADQTEPRALWTNAAWAGSQRFPLHGSGISIAGMGDLAGALRAILSLGLSGFPFCGLDFGLADPPTPAFYARWMQLGLFASHTRAAHLPPRAVSETSDGLEAILRKYVELRYRLMPYLYSEAIECCRSSLPLVRTLALEFADDPTSIMIEDEFMFGRSLLVAPILDNANRRNVYLPQGVWFDYWSKQPLHGGHWLTVEAPLDRLPMYVLGGSIIPYAPLAQHIGALHLDPLSIEIYAGENTGAYTIHQDDGSVITIRFEFMARQVMFESDPTPGEVELVIRDFGSKPQTARADGRLGLHLLVNR